MPAVAEDHTPKPYSPDEFNAWMKDLWRADAVFVGSFPFSLFLTLEVYDTYRYVNSGFQSSYAPWPLGSGSAITYTDAETAWLAVSALSLSLVVAGIDWIIGVINERSQKN
jgi:hypothetical protein